MMVKYTNHNMHNLSKTNQERINLYIKKGLSFEEAMNAWSTRKAEYIKKLKEKRK